jgi:preprotein translocase SecE subunit
VPESADVIEAELAEEGANLDELAAERPDGAEAQKASETEEAPKKQRRRLRSPAPSRADVGQPEDAAVAEPPAEDKISRRARRQEEKERERRRRESAKRREPPTQPTETRQRGRGIRFFISSRAELKRVQWPDRETLIQASMVTVIFIAVAAAYLGALDALFNWLVQRLI